MNFPCDRRCPLRPKCDNQKMTNRLEGKVTKTNVMFKDDIGVTLCIN